MFIRAISIAVLVIVSALAAPALAQTIPVPATRELIDDNGVDLFRGAFTVEETVASLGTDQAMTYRRIFRGGKWTTNLEALLQSDVTYIYATVSGRTDRFSKSTHAPTEANGSTLSYSNYIYTYRARDGTVVTFNKSYAAQATPNKYGNEGFATSIVSPDGERIDFTYELKFYCYGPLSGGTCPLGYVTTRRLISAKSAYGYMLNLSYASNVLNQSSDLGPWFTITDQKLVNLSVDYCAPTAPGCATTQDWPSVNNSNHVVNSYVMTGADLTGVRRPGSAANDLTITYSGGKVSAVADHAGTTTYAYADNAGSRTVTVTSSLSPVSTYVFNIASERLTGFTDPSNHTTSYQYDGSARLTRITRPEGNYTNLTYDGRGNVTEVRHVAKSGSGAVDIVTTAAFPATCTNPATCNSPTSTTDARGNTTDYTYDATHGGVLTITAPAPTVGALRPERRFSYATLQAKVRNSSGVLVSTGINVTLPASVRQCATLASCAFGTDEVVSQLSRSGNNNLQAWWVGRRNGDGTLDAKTYFTFDIYGNIVTADGPLAGTDDTTTAIYDPGAPGSPGIRRVIGTITPDPDGAGGRPRLAARNSFATNGDVTKVEVGTVTGTTLADLNAITVAQGTEMTYDADGMKLTDKLTGGGSSHALAQYSYDSEHRLQCAAQRMNPAEWASLPADACTLDTQGSFGPDRITKTLRDSNGRPTDILVAFGVTGQEAMDRKLGYNANGTLAHLIDANLNRTTYEYDGHDRLVKTRFPLPAIGSNSSSTTDYEQLTLDAAGNVTTRRLRDGQSIGYTFDALNRLTVKDLPGTEPDATYGYDLLNRMTSAVQSGITNAMTWDALSRMLTETAPQGTVTSEYDLAGRRTKVTLPGATTLFANYNYDLIGNVTFIRENGATSGVGVLATYAYDSLSRRISVTFGNGAVQNYTYDNAARLATQTNDLASTVNDLAQTFSYNPASQISSVTRSNDLYGWTGHSNVNLGSTPNGLNQIGNFGAATVTHDARGNITAVGTSNYGYSSENFLTSGPGSAALGYDPMGRLYQVAQGGTTRFSYDGVDRIAEYDGSNAIQRRYIHGPGVDEPLVWYEGAAITTRRFLSSDERGSVISVTDESGAVLALNKYDEYGVPQSGNSGKFGYTGQAWVPEVGLWYYKARFYRPDIGRFMQTDPIGYVAGMNLYSYVGNDPVSWTDPLGLDEELVVKGDRNPPTPVPPGAMTAEDYARQGQQAFVSHLNYLLGAALNRCTSNPTLCGVEESIIVTGQRRNRDEEPAQLPGSMLNLAQADQFRLRDPPPYNPHKNWCGPEGGTTYPQGVWNDACYNHDICYGTISSVKLTCDRTFYTEIIFACEAAGFECPMTALVYWAAVVRLGHPLFNPRLYRKRR